MRRYLQTQDEAQLKGHCHAELGSASKNTDRVKFKSCARAPGHWR
ncbi:MAG: hypothetical protein RLZ59_821 [Pseudomonadota bacterium]|jgi:hypothetical protein